MSGGWPSTIDPIRLAEKGAHLTGELPLRTMRRLADQCLDDTGTVAVDLAFSKAQGEGIRLAQGAVRGRLRLQCQRCLEPLDFPIDVEIRLMLLRPGERKEFAEAPESFVVEKPIPVAALVEDDLLLAMPMIPMHAPEECPARRHIADTDEAADSAGKNRPFRDLDRLNRK